MGYMGDMMGFGWGAAMWVSLLLGLGLLALVTIGVVAGIRWLAQSGPGVGGGRGADGALEILRERYARGEISREEFQRMREDLSHGVGS